MGKKKARPVPRRGEIWRLRRRRTLRARKLSGALVKVLWFHECNNPDVSYAVVDVFIEAQPHGRPKLERRAATVMIHDFQTVIQPAPPQGTP